ncbi:MAG: DMT family transporter, partial [Acinetobacter sp.]|nr:DMT family transporter [Acinetobacter sp.]
MIYFLFAFLAGTAAAMQAAINSQLSKSIGQQPLLAAFISFAIGTIFLLVLVIAKVNFAQALTALPHVALWKFIGGFLGVIFVSVTIIFSPKVGLANLLFFIILGQLCSAMLIDHFGLFQMPTRPITWAKCIGVFLMICGLAIFLFGDQ